MECLIAFGSDPVCLVYPRIVSDSRVRSGYLDLVVVALDIARIECYVARRQIEPNPKHEVQGCGCILQCFLIAGDATGEVNGRGNRVFDISQKLFLGVKCRPILRIFDHVWACAPRIAQTYVPIESLRRSTPACVKPSDLSRTNVVQTLEILAFFGWKNGPCATSACLCPRWSHEGTPRSETLTSVIHLLPPVLFRRNGELSAKPLVGSRVICILLP